MASLDQTPAGDFRFARGFDGGVIGVAGRGASDIDYSCDAAAVRRRERGLLASLTGIRADRFAFLSQVHGDTIVRVDGDSDLTAHSVAEADGIITDEARLCLVIRTADCVPVFVHDSGRGVLGAAHSGWRGSLAGIAGALVRSMCDRYGCDPRDMNAFILPSIGPESYIVGADVAQLFPAEDHRSDGDVIRLDLWNAVERSLREAGVPAGAITNARRCTYRENGDFFSHRRGDAGRCLNFGFLLSNYE